METVSSSERTPSAYLAKQFSRKSFFSSLIRAQNSGYSRVKDESTSAEGGKCLLVCLFVCLFLCLFVCFIVCLCVCLLVSAGL